MSGAVTNRQLFFILLLTLTSGSLISIPKDSYKAAGTGAWVTILILTVVFAIEIMIIASLNKRFEGKTIGEYSSLLAGKSVAFIINFMYTSYFLLVVTVLFRIIAELVKGSFLFITPVWAILFIFIATSFYIAYKGITNIGRLCEIYGTIFIIVPLAVHVAMFYTGDIKHIQPFFEPMQMKVYIFAVKDLFVSFLGIEILTIIPFGSVNNKKGILYSVLGIIYVGVFYIIATESSVMILGVNDVLNYNNSLIVALRETRLPSTILLERVDLLFLTVGFFGIISGLSIVTFAAVENVSKLIPKANKNKSFLIIGIFVYGVSTFALNNELAIFLFNNIVSIYGIFIAFIIPITLFIVAKVKDYAK